MEGARKRIPNASSERNEARENENEQSRGWEAVMRKESGHLHRRVLKPA